MRTLVAAISLALALAVAASPAESRRYASSAGLPAPLQSALAKVAAACPGFAVISTYRPGARVRGSGRTSLHASYRAADFRVDHWACAYGALAGFAGGMSTDPTRIRPPHIHISWAPGSREFGRHFAHWQPHRTAKHHRHYAKRYRHHRRYV